jgi:hypothetical protein
MSAFILGFVLKGVTKLIHICLICSSKYSREERLFRKFNCNFRYVKIKYFLDVIIRD